VFKRLPPGGSSCLNSLGLTSLIKESGMTNDYVQIVEDADIPRENTLREVIDELIEKTDWNKFEAMSVDLDEGEFTVQISVFKTEVMISKKGH
jgi:hypothetical protein